MATASEAEIADFEACISDGDRRQQRDLHTMKKSLDSLLRVIPWLEQPEPWQGPDDGVDAAAGCGDADDGDPERDAFLGLLQADIDDHPERLKPLDKGQLDRARELVRGVQIDLDAPFPDDE